MNTYDSYEKMEKYVKMGSLSKLRQLMIAFPKNNFLKFEYAKLLAETNAKGNLNKAELLFLKLTKYFNTSALYELARISKTKGDFIEASKYLETVISKSSIFHICNYYELACNKINLKEFDKAKEILNFVLENDVNNKTMFKLLSLNLTLGNYLDAFKIIKMIDSSSLDQEYKNKYNIAIIIVSKELNIFFPNFDYNQYNYTYLQILNYNSKLALAHITKHSNLITNDEYLSSFNSNVNIEELFKNIKNKLTRENFIDSNMSDNYIVTIPNIGSAGESLLRIVTIPNTKDILTMYPCKNYFRYTNKYDSPHNYENIVRK